VNKGVKTYLSYALDVSIEKNGKIKYKVTFGKLRIMLGNHPTIFNSLSPFMNVFQ